MEIEVLPEDTTGLTCPYVLSFPASPHLAAEIDKVELDFDILKNYTKQLLSNYDIILTEGAGGLLVPLTPNYTIVDYLKETQLPLILVSSSKLGSINHTLMSFEICLK